MDAESESASSSGGEGDSAQGNSGDGDERKSGSNLGARSSVNSTSNGGDGSSTPKEKEARSESKYDKENTDVVLARAARQVKGNCGSAKDDEGKMIGPWGKVSIKVLLGRNGHTRSVSVPAPFDGKPVGKCIANAFSILQYPPWSGSDTEVDWDVEVIEPAKPGKK
jgi:hypothetical protein